jgi:DNA replication and repair protein RecF
VIGQKVPPLHLASLSIAQFRSYAHAVLAFDGRPVVLIGPNGAGKTNLLEAVSMLSPGRGLRGAAPADMARKPGTLGWRLWAGLVRGGETVEVVLTGEPEGRRRIEIDGRSETQTRLGQLIPMLWLTPSMDRLWLEGAEGRRRFIDRAALSFEPAHAEASLRYDRAMRERNRLLRDGPADPAWLAALEAQMAESGVRVALARLRVARRLTMAQDGAKTLFPKAEIAILGTMEGSLLPLLDAHPEGGDAPLAQAAGIVADFAATLARGRREDAAAGRTLSGPHRSDMVAVMQPKGIPAAQCSTGEQKAILLSLVLANARALAAAGSRPLLLMDEIAAHLDDGRRSALFDELTALPGQCFVSGTEIGLFGGLAEHAQVLAVRETEAGSVVEAA